MELLLCNYYQLEMLSCYQGLDIKIKYIQMLHLVTNQLEWLSCYCHQLEALPCYQGLHNKNTYKFCIWLLTNWSGFHVTATGWRRCHVTKDYTSIKIQILHLVTNQLDWLPCYCHCLEVLLCYEGLHINKNTYKYCIWLLINWSGCRVTATVWRCCCVTKDYNQ